MKKSFLLVLLLTNFFGFAQYTLIPDVNFEKELISLGIDSGTPDGRVLTANAANVLQLDVTYRGITNLTGIEDFTSLKILYCNDNLLTNLNVTKNTFLEHLNCYFNALIDLDLSNNKDLTYANCTNNKLLTLNVKNGTNTTKNLSINSSSNPNLICIQVDNKSYSNTNWYAYKDVTASYSENCSKTSAAIVPPVITATGNQTYCPGTSLKIVQTISITNDPTEPDTDAIYIQISSGYINGQDKLTLANPAVHSNITTSWDATAGKLKLYSPLGTKILYTDFVSAIQDVEFSNSSTSPSGTRNFSITIGQANYLPSTGHYYQFVSNVGITWTSAKTAAEALDYYGLKGYLATILSSDEAQISGEQAQGAGWIGGSDATTEGVWKWVTGPEAGTTMTYTKWNTGEPNQYLGRPENYAHITASGVGITGSWNDLTNTGDTNGDFQPKGFIVEYGGMPGDPTLQFSASTKITIPRITSTTPNTICGLGIVTLQATATDGIVSWYDSKTGGTLLNTGNSFTTPNLTTTTSFYVDASNGNCPNGPRTEVIATIMPLPSLPQIAAASTSPISYCLNDTAIPLAATASANCTLNWYPSKIGGTSSTTSPTPSTASIGTTSYYVSQTITGTNCEGSRAEIIVTVNPLPTTPTNVNNISYCNSETAVPLTATASTNCSLNWYPPTGGISSTTSPTPSTASVGITRYYVSQTITATGCEGPKAEIIVTVYPIIKTNEEVLLCQSETVTLDASISGMSYLWSPNGETSQTIIVSNIGDYSVTISSPLANCDSKKDFKVIEHPEPKIKEIVVDENSITIELSNPENYYEFSIDGELFTTSNQFSRIPSGQYTAFVREKNGCNLIEQDFSIFSIAKYFTPNNDGFNDVWEIKEMKNYPNSRVAIFNRYGKLLKQLNYRSSGWNGTFNGLELPADDYWYVLKLEDSKPEIKGHFTLKR